MLYTAVIRSVNQVIIDALAEYNLSINDNKIKKYLRPFSTEKSTILIGVKQLITKYRDNLFDVKHTESGMIYVPKKIKSKNKFLMFFTDNVKAICKNSGTNYSDVSCFIISCLTRTTNKFVESIDRYDQEKINETDVQVNIRTSILILLETIFFFYAVNPTISSSDKIAKCLILVDRLFSTKLKRHLSFVREEVLEKITTLEFDNSNEIRSGFVSLEKLNLLLAISGYDKNYIIEKRVLDEIFHDRKNLGYFEIVSLLFYIKDYDEYEKYRLTLEQIVYLQVKACVDFCTDSEMSHLFLDAISCPYINTQIKENMLKHFHNMFGIVYSDASIASEVAELSKTFWFVKWKSLDILKLLERKELKSVY
jgi:hypothetical protein